MSYHADYADASAYAQELTGFVLEPVLVVRKGDTFLVGTQRQADLLFVEPTDVLLTVGRFAEVN